jgi:hypothetical protein
MTGDRYGRTPLRQRLLPCFTPEGSFRAPMHLQRSLARAALSLAAFFALVPPLNAQLAALETDDLRLVYIDPIHSYLAPHVASCFQNSMQFQRTLFDYEPSEKVTVILSDFADYGNAGAGAVPRNGLAVSIAPMGFAYETYP